MYGPAVGEVTVNGPTMNGDHQNVKNDTSGFTIDVNPQPGAAAGDSTGPALPPGGARARTRTQEFSNFQMYGSASRSAAHWTVSSFAPSGTM